jgi:hypothetical protein
MNRLIHWPGILAKHQSYLDGLLDGSIDESYFFKPSMSVSEAIAQERKNVAFCQSKLAELDRRPEGE